MKNFDDILQYLLTEAEAHPDMKVEDMVAKFAEKFDLSMEEVAEIRDSFLSLDEINDKAQDLAAAREEGSTRDGWMKRQLSQIAEKCGDDAAIVIDKIEKGTHNALNDTLSQEV